MNSLAIKSCIPAKKNGDLLCAATLTVLHAVIVAIFTSFFKALLVFFSCILLLKILFGYIHDGLASSELGDDKRSKRWTCCASEWVNCSTTWEGITAYASKPFVTRCKMNSMFILANFIGNLVAPFFMIIIPTSNFTWRLCFLDTFLICCGNIFNFNAFT